MLIRCLAVTAHSRIVCGPSHRMFASSILQQGLTSLIMWWWCFRISSCSQAYSSWMRQLAAGRHVTMRYTWQYCLCFC